MAGDSEDAAGLGTTVAGSEPYGCMKNLSKDSGPSTLEATSADDHDGRMSTTTRISGASAWEQELYDHLVSHGAQEGATLNAYRQLVETTDSPAFAYLAGLILDDERRHHAMLNDLAETIRVSAGLNNGPLPIPALGMLRADRERILEQTEQFLALEKQDQRELKELAKEMSDVRDNTAWQLVVRLMEHDNAKHQMILEFIRDRARKPR